MDRIVCPKCKHEFEHDMTPLEKDGYQFVHCPGCGYSITAITKELAKTYAELNDSETIFKRANEQMSKIWAGTYDFSDFMARQ